MTDNSVQMPPGHKGRLLRLSAFKLETKVTDLIRGVLPEQSLSVLYGEPGSGKTFVAIDMALTLASGRPWHGRRSRPTSVVYIAGEGWQAKRVEAWMQTNGDPQAELPMLIYPDTVDLTNRADTDALAKEIASAMLSPPLLIIVDTLARCMGDADENSPQGMGAAILSLDFLRRQTGAAVMAIHHVGKDPNRGVRGHSSLRGAVDQALLCEFLGRTGARRLSVEKARDGQTGPVIDFELRGIEVSVDDEGQPIQSCALVQVETDERQETEPSLSPMNRGALGALQKAIIDLGQPAPPGKHYPTGVRVVRDDQFWNYFQKSGISGASNDNGARRSYRLSKVALKKRGLAGEWDNLIWLCDPDEGAAKVAIPME